MYGLWEFSSNAILWEFHSHMMSWESNFDIITWEFHSHDIVWELQCIGMENYQFLKSVVGIMLP